MQEMILVKRAVPTKNQELFNLFDVDYQLTSNSSQAAYFAPVVFLIRHMKDHSKRFIRLEDHMRTQNTDVVHNESNIRKSSYLAYTLLYR
jgi:hypothetical protein